MSKKGWLIKYMIFGIIGSIFILYLMWANPFYSLNTSFDIPIFNIWTMILIPMYFMWGFPAYLHIKYGLLKKWNVTDINKPFVVREYAGWQQKKYIWFTVFTCIGIPLIITIYFWLMGWIF